MVRLMGGLVLWISTLYCGPKARTGKGRGREGSGLYPELAVLGFSEGSSPALASRVARLTALLPSFQTARDELARDGVPLNIKEVENAEAMLALRAAALTGRWEEALEHARAAMARDRRLNWRWQSPDMPAELKAQVSISPPSPQRQPSHAAASTAA